MTRNFRFGSLKITVNFVPVLFLSVVIASVLFVVFEAPPETAALVLTPSGIFAMIAASVMKEAFSVSDVPGDLEFKPQDRDQDQDSENEK